MKNPRKIAESGLAGVLNAALGGGTPQDMLDAMQKMVAEARTILPDNPVFQAQMDEIAAQHVSLAAGQHAFQEAQASGDPAQIDAALAGIAALNPCSDPETGIPAEVIRLRDAIYEGDMEAVQAALTGVDLNRGYGRYGTVPIWWAMHAAKNRLALLTALLNAGARADYATDEGYTPLHWVSDAGYSNTPVQAQIALLLVARGGDVGARNRYGWTPLQAAVLEGSAEELAALLAVGADPDLPYAAYSMPEFTRGLTPLMVAAANPDKVALLLNHGADPGRCAADGTRPEDYMQAQIVARPSRLDGLVSRLLAGKEPSYASEVGRSLALIRTHSTGARDV